MENKRCLYCYQILDNDNNTEYHIKCSNTFFGTNTPPLLELNNEILEEAAKENIIQSRVLTGVQPKLSLSLDDGEHNKSRLTIVGLWGNYILKPQSKRFPFMPENEDLTMHLSDLLGIKTARHSLIRTTNGELAYITKRYDRVGKEKVQCEDLCQLSEKLTEDKYKGSMERVGKRIKETVSNPLYDAISFFETTLFCFLTGNADMHLKNFSILKDAKGQYNLSPAYDLLATKLLMPDDLEEMALTINARKSKITKNDFVVLGKSLGMNEKQINGCFQKIAGSLNNMIEFVKISFLPIDIQNAYIELINSRSARIV